MNFHTGIFYIIPTIFGWLVNVEGGFDSHSEIKLALSAIMCSGSVVGTRVVSDINDTVNPSVKSRIRTTYITVGSILFSTFATECIPEI